jgi:adenylate cyclase
MLNLRRLLARAARPPLPERVLGAIAAQEDASERLIGWVQLAVVATFGTLYLIAPKTFRNTSFEPVPWALALYGLFTLLRLALAHRLRLPSWFLTLSIAIDIALLMVLIWSFHLQYEQPASFYLKAPTLLYLFIFISLRALRFEARYVLLAGLLGALGWLLMLYYAVRFDPARPMITRNYVEYLTSNAILIGAEFDKIISILVVTGILAVVISRARALLQRAVVEGTAARELSRFFAPAIAQQITSAKDSIRAGEGVVREAAILFLDVRGFTKLAGEVGPNEILKLLAEYQARLVPIVQQHGGSIDKFLGDGILATFGAAVETKTFAADAIRAVDGVMRAVEDWNLERARQGRPSIGVGAAVASGRVIFGAVGDATRLEYTVIGDPANLAAKLEKHTKAERVRALAARASFVLAMAQGYQPPGSYEERQARRVEGVGEPVDLVVLAA